MRAAARPGVYTGRPYETAGGGLAMKIVVWKSPRFLKGFLRLFFGFHRQG